MKTQKNHVLWPALFLCVFVGHSCDRFHKKKCEWLIVPEFKTAEDLKASRLDSKWLPICARNIETNKQSCDYVTTLSVAKQFSKEKFRFADIVLKDNDNRFPRKIISIRKKCK